MYVVFVFVYLALKLILWLLIHHLLPSFPVEPSVNNTNVQNKNFPTSFAHHLTHVCTTNCDCWMVYEMTLQFVSPIGADSGRFPAFSSIALRFKKNLHPANLFLQHTHYNFHYVLCSRLSTNKMEIWWDHFSVLFVQPAHLVSLWTLFCCFFFTNQSL